MITNFFIPELNNHDVRELWFQQDGATCHTARATIDLLKDTFGDRLISRFGPVNWPPTPLDLTPLDYLLWGYVKSLVYVDKPQTLDHLEDNIRRVIADIRPQTLKKVIENWTTSEPAVAVLCQKSYLKWIFSDESKFNIHGSDGHQKVWRKANAALEPKNMRGTVKHDGGSFMVSGCMAATGVENLVIIDGIMNQLDKDSKHTARVVWEWLLYNVRKQIKPSQQSPDLNPIEHLWDYLDRQIRKQEIKTKIDLKKALLEEWQKIPSSVTQNLVKSVSSRLRDVIKAKGYPTNY
ncbi:transposable element Tcb2 transposase [Trichonephila clavipes]|nr:transposable element Tcb2 transposase [Trichonephila clavipes]